MSDRRPATESELIEFVQAIDVRAPESLHRDVESMLTGRSRRGAHRRGEDSPARVGRAAPRLAALGAIAAVLAAVVIAVGLSGGGGSPPSVDRASALTLLPAKAAPPPENPGNHTQLTASVDDVPFPYWSEHFGWHSTGARTDRIAGRTITTVFYENSRGQRVGYAIVSGAAPKRPAGSTIALRNGTPYWTISRNGVKIVTWLRGGHLCVVSGRGVTSATLLRLASWNDHDVAA
jgi:hypothetical protein